MGSDLQSMTFRERVAGKWQVPLMVLSAFLFVGTIVSLRPERPVPSVEEWVDEINSLKRGLLLPEAAALARTILQDGHYHPDELGPIYAALADVLFRSESAKTDRQDRRLLYVLATYAQAELLGFAPDGDALYQQGQVYEWLGQPRNALEQYELSLKHAPSDPLAVRRQALSLQLYAVRTPRSQLHLKLDELLKDATERPEILQWTLEQKVQLLIDEDRLTEGEDVVSNYHSYLADTPYEPFVECLTGLLQYKNKKYDQAELTLRNLRSKLKIREDIHARSGWLLGKVILLDDGPQRPLEAITFFKDVLDAHAVGEYVTASRLGMAEALTDLQRFDEALEYYQAVLADLKSIPQTRLLNRRAVRDSLAIRSRLLHEEDHYGSALAYLQLAADLVDLDDDETRSFYLSDLASMKESLGKRQRDQSRIAAAGRLEMVQALGQRSRELFRSAADDYLELSKLKTADESQAAAALWRAASMYDSAGHRSRTIELLEGFLLSRPISDQIPMALFKLGQAYQAQGRLQRAIEQYQRCIRDYPRTTAAYDSYIPLADCFVMLGPDYSQQAEDTLLFVLDEPPDEPNRFTPQSSIYSDAVFKIGDLYFRDGQYEHAVEWLDEALQRYPNDARYPRATFLLAQAYRHSGLDLETVATDMSNALRREQLQQEKRNRLRRAEELFGQVITRLSGDSADSLTPMQQLQLQLSYTYRADCAFDLGEYERALDLYQEVVRAFREDPIALAAYVQIISNYESLGRTEEIKPALQRAHWLTDKMDPKKFESRLIRNSPADWHKLLAWIADTGEYD